MAVVGLDLFNCVFKCWCIALPGRLPAARLNPPSCHLHCIPQVSIKELFSGYHVSVTLPDHGYIPGFLLSPLRRSSPLCVCRRLRMYIPPSSSLQQTVSLVRGGDQQAAGGPPSCGSC